MSKYDQVLRPFVAMMERELHANAGKGDRPGWLAMSADTCLLEIFYHLGKLQKAVKKSEGDGIGEYAADVANMCMMLADICGVLALTDPVPPAGVEPDDPESAWEDTFGPDYEDDSEPVEVVAVISTEPREHGHYFTPDELRRHNQIYKTIPAKGYTTELVDRAHVTRLQAEVERLNSKIDTMRNKNNELNDTVAALQAELTKAREVIKQAHDRIYANETLTAYMDLRDYLSNQSAPADKAPPLIQALHANGDLIAMEATIAQQAQRIADLEADKSQGEPFAWWMYAEGQPDSGFPVYEPEVDTVDAHGVQWRVFPLYRHPAEQPAPVSVESELLRAFSDYAKQFTFKNHPATPGMFPIGFPWFKAGFEAGHAEQPAPVAVVKS